MVQIICADVLEGLRQIPDQSVHCVVTSPPYMGLRSYGLSPREWPDGSCCVLGEEPTIELYIDHLVGIFREMKRVMHPTATFWLNMGDRYASGGYHPEPVKYPDVKKPVMPKTQGMAGKNLLMVPARVALALQADGWVLRNDIIWAKGLSFCSAYSGSVMPESTQDRCSWAHEHVFHFALDNHYYYD